MKQVDENTVFIFQYTQTQLSSAFTEFVVEFDIQIVQLGLFEFDIIGQFDSALRKSRQVRSNFSQTRSCYS